MNSVVYSIFIIIILAAKLGYACCEYISLALHVRCNVLICKMLYSWETKGSLLYITIP